MEKYINRKSTRSYKKYDLTKEEIQYFTDVINNSPTSTNTQQFSAIIFTDQEKKEYMQKNNNGQSYISDASAIVLFIADRSRVSQIAKNNNIELLEEVKHQEFMRTVMDATIAATYLHDSAIRAGFQPTFLGGVLTNSNEVREKFNLPHNSFPILALTIGKVDVEADIKPKMNKVFINDYSFEESINNLKEYSESSKEYYAGRNRPEFIEQVKEIISADSNFYKSFVKSSKQIEEYIKSFK